MVVFPKNSPYLPTKKIGKNNPKDAEIKENNMIVDKWNEEVLQARSMGVPKQSMMETKRPLIIDPVRESISKANGNKDPVSFRNILIKAVKTLRVMLMQRRYMDGDDWSTVWREKLGDFIRGCKELAEGILETCEINYQHGNDETHGSENAYRRKCLDSVQTGLGQDCIRDRIGQCKRRHIEGNTHRVCPEKIIEADSITLSHAYVTCYTHEHSCNRMAESE
jgi:hypothetical protein